MTGEAENRRILVIEDDPAIRRGLVDALRFADYTVCEEATGEGGRASALRLDCDLVLLDLVLPGVDGLSILREIRRARPALPVIVLTARGSEEDRVRGLEIGADDYVVKPFSARELLARVAAVLRRSAERAPAPAALALDGVTVDLVRHELLFPDGRRTPLTEKESVLLRYLAERRGQPVSREELLEYVWRVHPRANAESRMVDMTVARLREKLGEDPDQASRLVTVRGRGYMLQTGGQT